MADRLNPTEKDLRHQADKGGIYDVDPSDARFRCEDSIVIKGQGYQCSLVENHVGWAHQSLEAEALW